MGKQYYVQLPETGTIIATDNPSMWREAVQLTAAEGKRLQRAEALARLHDILQPESTVYTKVETVAASGMSRTLSVYAACVDDKGRPYIQRLTVWVARTIGATMRGDNLVMQGGGMDMGFETVYRLGQAMWPAGTPEPHGYRNGEPDSAGGYALKHSAL